MQRMERTNTIGIIILGLITHDIAAVGTIFKLYKKDQIRTRMPRVLHTKPSQFGKLIFIKHICVNKNLHRTTYTYKSNMITYKTHLHRFSTKFWKTFLFKVPLSVEISF